MRLLSGWCAANRLSLLEVWRLRATVGPAGSFCRALCPVAPHFFWVRRESCQSYMSLTHSQPALADEPIRGSSETPPSRKPCM